MLSESWSKLVEDRCYILVLIRSHNLKRYVLPSCQHENPSPILQPYPIHYREVSSLFQKDKRIKADCTSLQPSKACSTSDLIFVKPLDI